MNDNICFFQPNDFPYGKSYGSWTVEWWRWVLAIPKPVNPVLDNTGRHFNINQPENDVIFLAGKFADSKEEFPYRVCRIPHEKSILFPVINCESNKLESPELITNQDIISRVNSDENSIVQKHCTVNGVTIPSQRVKSDPMLFELYMDKDNLFGVAGGGTTYASADGYWVFLRPLPKGKHKVQFQGSCEFGKLNSGAIYDLEIF